MTSFYDFINGSEYLKMYLDTDSKNKIIMKMKTDDSDIVKTYSVNNGVMYVSPDPKIKVIEGVAYYSFPYHIFNYIDKIKTVVFVCPEQKIIFRVPFPKFIESSMHDKSSDKVSKKLYVERRALWFFAKNLRTDNVPFFKK